ncbi:MAG TPA: PqqD family protein [Thermoflexales bacterium]|nr:PqqD family protein [Thermoflexales bacterium]HQW35458.1 PqqD family protein [Thermoflexales bacterium]HQZ21187.1 PqqD family protein [Thermoflexales bacterium]
MIDFTQKVSVPEDTLIRELEGESVLLNLTNEKYYGLNKVGTRMWNALEKSASIQAAYDQLKAEYDVEPQRLRDDLEKLIAQLQAQGLISIRN